MALYPKFVLLKDGSLVIGKVEFHRDLVEDKSSVKSGGWYDLGQRSITFYGESIDFGRFEKEDLIKSLQQGDISPLGVAKFIEDAFCYYAYEIWSQQELINLS